MIVIVIVIGGMGCFSSSFSCSSSGSKSSSSSSSYCLYMDERTGHGHGHGRGQDEYRRLLLPLLVSCFYYFHFLRRPDRTQQLEKRDRCLFTLCAYYPSMEEVEKRIFSFFHTTKKLKKLPFALPLSLPTCPPSSIFLFSILGPGTPPPPHQPSVYSCWIMSMGGELIQVIFVQIGEIELCYLISSSDAEVVAAAGGAGGGGAAAAAAAATCVESEFSSAIAPALLVESAGG